MNNKFHHIFIVILKYIVTLEKIDAHRDEHLQFLEQYYKKGIFIASGPQIPRSGGVVLAKCENKSHLKNILLEDPFVKNNLVSYEIIEFMPTKYNDSFDDVFNNSHLKT